MTIISVGRNGEKLGDYDLAGIREGLASGFFLPGDLGWYEGLPEWIPLSDVVTKLSVASAPLEPSLEIRQEPKLKTEAMAYVIKDAKHQLGKPKTEAAPSWRTEPATEKQFAFLRALGAERIPATLTRGQAHDRIDTLLASGLSFNSLTPEELAALDFHGFDTTKLDFEEAKKLLERIRVNPHSFKVQEPWEYAKTRLYPKLFPPPPKKQPRSCLVLLIVAAVGLLVLLYFLVTFLAGLHD